MANKAGSGIGSSDIRDRIVLYYVEHGIQILTAIALFIILLPKSTSHKPSY